MKIIIKRFLIIINIFILSNIYSYDTTYYPVNRIISYLKIDVEYNNLKNSIFLKKNNKSVYIVNYANYILFSGEKSFLNDFVISENGQILIPIDTALEVLSFFSPQNYKYYIEDGDIIVSENEKLKNIDENYSIDIEYSDNSINNDNNISNSTQIINCVILDPGHGGKDPGAVGYNGIKEKDIVLTVGLILQKKLAAKYKNKKVIITRDKDVFIPLEDRANIANDYYEKYGNSIFISIHVNSSRSNKSYGFETWHLTSDYKRDVLNKDKISDDKVVADTVNTMIIEQIYNQSKDLAKKIQNNLEKQIGYVSRNRGIKEEQYFVIKKSVMPAVLVEIGFNSNKYEAIRLTNYSYLNKITDGILEGINEFVYQYEKK